MGREGGERKKKRGGEKGGGEEKGRENEKNKKGKREEKSFGKGGEHPTLPKICGVGCGSVVFSGGGVWEALWGARVPFPRRAGGGYGCSALVPRVEKKKSLGREGKKHAAGVGVTPAPPGVGGGNVAVVGVSPCFPVAAQMSRFGGGWWGDTRTLGRGVC